MCVCVYVSVYMCVCMCGRQQQQQQQEVMKLSSCRGASASGKVISLPSNKSYIKVIEKKPNTVTVTVIKGENRAQREKKSRTSMRSKVK